jgi:hypothetical protein
MPLEAGTTLEDLNDIWPLGSDSRSQGDDHIRLLKSILKIQFPGVDGDGFKIPITATEAEINFSAGLDVNIKAKFTTIDNTMVTKVTTPVSDAPYILRDNTFVKDGYRVKTLNAASVNTDVYNTKDYVRILYSGAVVINIGGVTEIGKTLTFEKANAANSVTFVNAAGTVYGPDIDPITEEGKMFCLVAVDTNEWRLIV